MGDQYIAATGNYSTMICGSPSSTRPITARVSTPAFLERGEKLPELGRRDSDTEATGGLGIEEDLPLISRNRRLKCHKGR